MNKLIIAEIIYSLNPRVPKGVHVKCVVDEKGRILSIRRIDSCLGIDLEFEIERDEIEYIKIKECL